jgi:hypothetical protein
VSHYGSSYVLWFLFLVVFIVFSFCTYISSPGSSELLALESLNIDVNSYNCREL